MRGQLFGDPLGRPHQIRREQHPRRPLGRRGTRHPPCHELLVPGALPGRGAVGRDDDQPLGDPGALAVGVPGPERPDLGELHLGEVLGLLRADHAAGQQVHPVFARPPGRAQTAGAVPQTPAQPRGVGLDPVGVHLEALDPAEAAGRLAAHQVQQPLHPAMAEVLEVGGAGVERLLEMLVVRRRADTDPRVEAAPGEDVHGRQILGEPQRVLPAERDHGRAELDPPGALGRGGEDGEGRGDPELQMTLTHPCAVESEPLAQFEEFERRLVPPARIGLVEQADGQKAQLLQRFRGRRHSAPPGSTACLRYADAAFDSRSRPSQERDGSVYRTARGRRRSVVRRGGLRARTRSPSEE